EPAFIRNHVEVRAARALAPDQQNGVVRLATADVAVGISRFNLALELLRALHNFMHAFEGVFAAMLQSHMRGLPEYRNAQSNRSTICIPNDPAGGLGGEHTDSGTAQLTIARKRCGAA